MADGNGGAWSLDDCPGLDNPCGQPGWPVRYQRDEPTAQAVCPCGVMEVCCCDGCATEKGLKGEGWS